MYIAEIIRPGVWLKLASQDISHEIEQMLSSMEDKVAEAAISLTMFEAANSFSASDHRADFDRDRQIRREVSDLLRQELGDRYYQDFDRNNLECDRRVLRRKAELGVLPRSYAHKVPFIHAHSFIYAVDSFGKFLEELCGYPNLPPAVVALSDSFDAQLPTIRKIRNSALHIEDRSRGFGTPGEKKKGKKMQTNGFLGLSNIEGNSLCYTIDDGTYQRVEISSGTLVIITEIMNQLLGLFDWEGPPRVLPS